MRCGQDAVRNSPSREIRCTSSKGAFDMRGQQCSRGEHRPRRGAQAPYREQECRKRAELGGSAREPWTGLGEGAGAAAALPKAHLGRRGGWGREIRQTEASRTCRGGGTGRGIAPGMAWRKPSCTQVCTGVTCSHWEQCAGPRTAQRRTAVGPRMPAPGLQPKALEAECRGASPLLCSPHGPRTREEGVLRGCVREGAGFWNTALRAGRPSGAQRR